jgi:hypothetical protein
MAGGELPLKIWPMRNSCPTRTSTPNSDPMPSASATAAFIPDRLPGEVMGWNEEVVKAVRKIG